MRPVTRAPRACREFRPADMPPRVAAYACRFVPLIDAPPEVPADLAVLSAAGHPSLTPRVLGARRLRELIAGTHSPLPTGAADCAALLRFCLSDVTLPAPAPPLAGVAVAVQAPGGGGGGADAAARAARARVVGAAVADLGSAKLLPTLAGSLAPLPGRAARPALLIASAAQLALCPPLRDQAVCGGAAAAAAAAATAAAAAAPSAAVVAAASAASGSSAAPAQPRSAAGGATDKAPGGATDKAPGTTVAAAAAAEVVDAGPDADMAVLLADDQIMQALGVRRVTAGDIAGALDGVLPPAWRDAACVPWPRVACAPLAPGVALASPGRGPPSRAWLAALWAEVDADTPEVLEALRRWPLLPSVDGARLVSCARAAAAVVVWPGSRDDEAVLDGLPPARDDGGLAAALAVPAGDRSAALHTLLCRVGVPLLQVIGFCARVRPRRGST